MGGLGSTCKGTNGVCQHGCKSFVGYSRYKGDADPLCSTCKHHRSVHFVQCDKCRGKGCLLQPCTEKKYSTCPSIPCVKCWGRHYRSDECSKAQGCNYSEVKENTTYSAVPSTQFWGQGGDSYTTRTCGECQARLEFCCSSGKTLCGVCFGKGEIHVPCDKCLSSGWIAVSV